MALGWTLQSAGDDAGSDGRRRGGRGRSLRPRGHRSRLVDDRGRRTWCGSSPPSGRAWSRSCGREPVCAVAARLVPCPPSPPASGALQPRGGRPTRWSCTTRSRTSGPSRRIWSAGPAHTSCLTMIALARPLLKRGDVGSCASSTRRTSGAAIRCICSPTTVPATLLAGIDQHVAAAAPAWAYPDLGHRGRSPPPSSAPAVCSAIRSGSPFRWRLCSSPSPSARALAFGSLSSSALR